jgi:uncharacterized protein (DUF58 family)
VTSWPDAAARDHLRENAHRASEVYALPFRRRTWSGAAGSWVGSGQGVSLEFQDHRTYVPGDDPRHINWAAYARTGVYSMKLYREEVRPSVDVILDASRSMFLDAAKLNRAVELACFAAASARRSDAHVKIFAATGPGVVPIDPGFESLPDASAVGAMPAPDLEAVPLRPGSLRVFISDCLFAGPPDALLARLTRSRGSAMVLAPFAADEADPPWRGQLELVDCDTLEERRQRVDSGVVAAYLQAYRRHFESWRDTCARFGVAFARVATGNGLLDALTAEPLAAGAVEDAQ